MTSPARDDGADEAGGCSPGLGDHGRPFGDVGLAEVVVGHGAAREANMARMTCATLLVAPQRHAHHLGDGLPGDVVLGRTQAPATDDGLAAGQGVADGGHDPAPGCPPPSPGNGSRSQPAPAARRSTPSWCRRPGRAAARCPRPRPRSASAHDRARASGPARQRRCPPPVPAGAAGLRASAQVLDAGHQVKPTASHSRPTATTG